MPMQYDDGLSQEQLELYGDSLDNHTPLPYPSELSIYFDGNRKYTFSNVVKLDWSRETWGNYAIVITCKPKQKTLTTNRPKKHTRKRQYRAYYVNVVRAKSNIVGDIFP